jgi:hypothetical protein
LLLMIRRILNLRVVISLTPYSTAEMMKVTPLSPL